MVEEDKQSSKHKPHKTGKSNFGASQYAKFKNKTVDDHNLVNKHKMENSGNGPNLLQ